MQNKQPIGIFDSGIGGTSIWKEIVALLPFENTIYLADSANAPYGVKSKEEIIQLCIKNTEELLNANAKIIVVACNTATTNAIRYLRNTYDVPFIGIEPAIKPAALQSKTKVIGVLATKGTLTSDLFAKTSEHLTTHISILEAEGTGLVELIEDDKIDSLMTFNLLKSYLKPLVKADIDHLVLGCSHYPFLIPVLKKIVPDEVTIIDSGEAVAKQTKNILKTNDLINNKVIPKYLFYTNGNPVILERMLSFSSLPKKIVQKAF